LKEHGIYALV